jgi:hypothetical protein
VACWEGAGVAAGGGSELCLGFVFLGLDFDPPGLDLVSAASPVEALGCSPRGAVSLAC